MRVPPLEPPFDEKTGALLTDMMPAGVPPIALFRTFARNPEMARAMHPWGSYELSRRLSVDRRIREIVIDRTCARCGCEYEWGVHVAFFADRVGLDRAQVTSLTHGGPDDDCWTSPVETHLIELVDALHDGSDVPDALWAKLATHFSEDQLLDLLLLVGWYHAISFVARGARVPLESGAPRFRDYAPPSEPTR